MTIHALEESNFTKNRKSSKEQIEIQSNGHCFFDIHLYSICGFQKVKVLINFTTFYVPAKICERIKRKRPELWNEKSRVLHQDNASILPALPASVKRAETKSFVLKELRITAVFSTMEHPHSAL